MERGDCGTLQAGADPRQWLAGGRGAVVGLLLCRDYHDTRSPYRHMVTDRVPRME
jgi:hypothetical protein